MKYDIYKQIDYLNQRAAYYAKSLEEKKFLSELTKQLMLIAYDIKTIA